MQIKTFTCIGLIMHSYVKYAKKKSMQLKFGVFKTVQTKQCKKRWFDEKQLVHGKSTSLGDIIELAFNTPSNVINNSF